MNDVDGDLHVRPFVRRDSSRRPGRYFSNVHGSSIDGNVVASTVAYAGQIVRTNGLP